MSRSERKVAVKAWRKVPVDARSETVRLARQGRPHPDAGVARIAETWSRSVVEGPWYGQVGGWPIIGLALLIITMGALTTNLFIWLAGIVILIAGFLGLNQRNVARRILVAARDRQL